MADPDATTFREPTERPFDVAVLPLEAVVEEYHRGPFQRPKMELGLAPNGQIKKEVLLEEGIDPENYPIGTIVHVDYAMPQVVRVYDSDTGAVLADNHPRVGYEVGVERILMED